MQSDSPYLKNGKIYAASTISNNVEAMLHGAQYTDILFVERVSLLSKYLHPGMRVLDLGCGNGEMLAWLERRNQNYDLAGIDFSERYIAYARENTISSSVALYTRDLCALPDAGVSPCDIAYSFSALYYVDNFSAFASGLPKILKTNAHCILDLGNKFSLNHYCSGFYSREDGWAQMFSPSINDQLHMLQDAGLQVIEHRCFQLLPLWAGKPRWLWPLLHPKWKDIMKRKIKGKMLDEWISSMPFLRKIAFRHIVVCRKEL